MRTIWIEEKQLARALARNEAFWQGELDDYPLMWVTVPDAGGGSDLPEPEREEEMWTDVDYVMASTEDTLARTYYAGDSLPVFNPWLGPDQVAAWLGADIILKPKDFTSWVKPFVDDWEQHQELTIDPGNRWWNLYLDTVRASAEAGKDKWVTAFPDLHTGIDGLCAIRRPHNLMMDMLTTPEVVHRAMRQMTDLWKYVVDVVTDIIMPAGQGSSNWTMGWSRDRYLCIGQNDFSCLIGPEMFVDFCWQDNLECCNHVDHTLYHLDGPDAARHLPKLLELENLTAIQWIQGAGKPPPSKWLDMLTQIQQAGKPIQLYYHDAHGGDADFEEELNILCDALDPTKLFIWAVVDNVEKADMIVNHARRICG
ncbi:MAG: uroporphyrinogen decarboxylase/cobalamine-independent methonine synthase family protein [Planctomycetota bacterium]|jgi:hypothetical protein